MDEVLEDKDAIGVDAAGMLLLGLTDDEADLSDSGEIRRSELISTRIGSSVANVVRKRGWVLWVPECYIFACLSSSGYVS